MISAGIDGIQTKLKRAATRDHALRTIRALLWAPPAVISSMPAVLMLLEDWTGLWVRESLARIPNSGRSLRPPELGRAVKFQPREDPTARLHALGVSRRNLRLTPDRPQVDSTAPSGRPQSDQVMGCGHLQGCGDPMALGDLMVCGDPVGGGDLMGATRRAVTIP